MTHLLFILLWLTPIPQCNLNTDLKRGRQILSHEHGVALYKEDRHYMFSVFDKYARMDLSGFAFSKKQSGKYTISSWKKKGKRELEIYQVETVLHVDTAITTYIYIDGPTKQKEEKIYINSDFHYRTYIINDNNRPQLVYTIGNEGNVLNYRIGTHVVSPLYEDVIIGQALPNEDEILRLIAKP